jgi:hypothetical protein
VKQAAGRCAGLALALLLWGCAAGPKPGWFFKTAAEAALPGPIAVWGYPETTADLGFACLADRRISFWLPSEAPISGGRPVRFRAGKAVADLTETFVDDGLGSSEFKIQPGSPLALAIAAGAPKLAWRLADGGRGSVTLGPEVRQLFSACAGHSPG